MKIISVFGSSRVLEGSADYRASQALGEALARAGYVVMTGGYAGVMEAASRGASDAGGHVIGVTSAQIEAIRPIPANRWVAEQREEGQMTTRLHHLIEQADGYVVMPGGVGTLNELVMAWELMRVGEIEVRPLVCYGDIWRDTLDVFMDDRYLSPEQQQMVTFADSVAEVVEFIGRGLEK